MCEKQVEETTAVNFPFRSVHMHIWDSNVPKIDLVAFDWRLGFKEEVQLIPQVQSGHCVSTRNRPGHSHCCCCHDSFNKQEHFEPLWLGLSNKSKHGQLLIDYIFQEHDKEGCSHWWMVVFSNPLPDCIWTGYFIHFIWFKLFIHQTFSAQLYNLCISPQGWLHITSKIPVVEEEFRSST